MISSGGVASCRDGVPIVIRPWSGVRGPLRLDLHLLTTGD